MKAEELEQLIAAASAKSEGEVVTSALSRDIKLPHTSGIAVLITMDNGRDHTRPNTLGARGLGELNHALDAALARDDVLAIAVTGKPFILAAGADLSMLLLRALGMPYSTSCTHPECRPSPSSTGSRWVVAWNSPCIATTGRSPPRPQPSLSPNASWAWSRPGEAHSWSPTCSVPSVLSS